MATRWQDRRLVVDEKEAPIRRQIFEFYLEHKRKRTVARLLNQAGFRTRNGSPLTATAVERLIVDPVAKGNRRTNYRNSPGRGGYFKKPSDWVYVDAPAVVSEELWQKANDLIKSQKSPNRRPAKRVARLFAGLVVCYCGPKMYVPSNGKSYTCQKCRNKVGETDLETVFIEQLKGIVLSPQQIAKHLEQSDEQIANKQQLLESLLQEKQSVGSEMDKLYRLYVADRVSDQLFAERNNPLEERLRQLQDEIPRLQAELDLLKLDLLSRDEIISEANDLFSRWPGLDFEERRAIIESITERIVIEDKEITINLAYLPSASASPKDGANRSRTLRDSERRSG